MAVLIVVPVEATVLDIKKGKRKERKTIKKNKKCFFLYQNI